MFSKTKPDLFDSNQNHFMHANGWNHKARLKEGTKGKYIHRFVGS